jgi:hypothetical protein
MAFGEDNFKKLTGPEELQAYLDLEKKFEANRKINFEDVKKGMLITVILMNGSMSRGTVMSGIKEATIEKRGGGKKTLVYFEMSGDVTDLFTGEQSNQYHRVDKDDCRSIRFQGWVKDKKEKNI